VMWGEDQPAATGLGQDSADGGQSLSYSFAAPADRGLDHLHR
jgi:hypothetical protein